jgi:hypothetical protein
VNDKTIAESIDDKRLDEKMECGWMKRCVPVSIRNSKFYHMASNVRPEWISAVSGILLCVIVLFGVLAKSETVVVYSSGDPRPITNLPVPQSGESSSDSSNDLISLLLGMTFILGFVAIDYFFYRKAMKEKDAVTNDSSLGTVKSKLEMLKEKAFWFDLPLHLGLLGTVLGFLLISIVESLAQVGRIVSYFSTIMGIVTSVIIHARVSLYRAKILREEEVRDE